MHNIRPATALQHFPYWRLFFPLQNLETMNVICK